MGFKKNVNEIKATLILVLIGIPLISSTNIDCIGRSFHCVNSTHFMICVDLGGGVSTTVDDFAIPCPPTTSCIATNRFECEFKAPTTPSPTLRTSDVTNEFDISATTQLWKNSDVTTIFPPGNTSGAQLADLQTFNTVSVTTLSSVTNGFTNTSQEVLNKNVNVMSNIPETTEYNLTPTSELVITDTVSSTEPLGLLENVTAIFPQVNLNESATNTDATNIVTTNIVEINETVTDVPGTVISTESSINTGNLTETTIVTIIEDSVLTNNKSEINVVTTDVNKNLNTTEVPVSSVINTTQNEMLTTMSWLVTGTETTTDIVTIANLNNTVSTISDVTINTLGIETTTQDSSASQNWQQPDIFQTGMQAGILQNMTTILPDNNFHEPVPVTNNGETINTVVISETVTDVPGTVISITSPENLINTAGDLTETTTVTIVKESVPNNVMDESVAIATTDINNNLNTTEAPVSSNLITIHNEMLTTISSLVSETETTTETVTIAYLNVTDSLFSQVTINTPVTETATGNLSHNSEPDLFQSGMQAGLRENMTTLSPEANFNKSATNTDRTNTEVIYEIATDLPKAVISTTSTESLINTAGNLPDSTTINEISVHINVANKSENSVVAADVNKYSNTTDVPAYTNVNTRQEESAQTNTDTVTISNLNITDLPISQSSQPYYLTGTQAASVTPTQDLYPTEITTSNTLSTISSSRMPGASDQVPHITTASVSDIPNRDNFVTTMETMEIDKNTSTVTTITTLSNVNLVTAEREMPLSTSSTDKAYFTEGSILATASNSETTYPTAQQEDLFATVIKTNQAQQTTSITRQGPSATGTAANNIITSNYNTENEIPSLNQNISTAGTEVPSNYTHVTMIESPDVTQLPNNVTVVNSASVKKQEQQNTYVTWSTPMDAESIANTTTKSTYNTENYLTMSAPTLSNINLVTAEREMPLSTSSTDKVYFTEGPILAPASNSDTTYPTAQQDDLAATVIKTNQVQQTASITLQEPFARSAAANGITTPNYNTENEIPSLNQNISTTGTEVPSNYTHVTTIESPDVTQQPNNVTVVNSASAKNQEQQNTFITWPKPMDAGSIANTTTKYTYNTENDLTMPATTISNVNTTETEVTINFKSMTSIERTEASIPNHANNPATENQQTQHITSVKWQEPVTIDIISNATIASTYISENNLIMVTTPLSNQNFGTTGAELPTVYSVNHITQEQPKTTVKWQDSVTTDAIQNATLSSTYIPITTSLMSNQNLSTAGTEIFTGYSSNGSIEISQFTEPSIPFIDIVNQLEVANQQTQDQENFDVKFQEPYTTATIANAITESMYSSDDQLIITTTTLPSQNLTDVGSEVTGNTRSSSPTEFTRSSAISDISTTASPDHQSTQQIKWKVPLSTEAFTNTISQSQIEPVNKTTDQNITETNNKTLTSEGSVNTTDNYLQIVDKVDKIEQATNSVSSISSQNSVASTTFTIETPVVVTEKSINNVENYITTQTYSETSSSSSSVQSTEQVINEHYPTNIAKNDVTFAPVDIGGISTTVKSNVVYVITESVAMNELSTMTVTDSVSLPNYTENKNVQSSSHNKIVRGSSGATNPVEGNMLTSPTEYSLANPTENILLETERNNTSFDVSVNNSTQVLEVVSRTEPYTGIQNSRSQNESVSSLPELTSPTIITENPAVNDLIKNPIHSDVIFSQATLQTNVNDVSMTNTGITTVDVVSNVYENKPATISNHNGETGSTVLQSKISSTTSYLDNVINEKLSVENNDMINSINTASTDDLTTTNLEQGQLDIYANMGQDVGKDRKQIMNIPITSTSLSTPLPSIIKAPTNYNSHIRTSTSDFIVTKPPIKETHDDSLYSELPGVRIFETSTLPIALNAYTNTEWSQGVTNKNKLETLQIHLHPGTNILDEDQQKVQTDLTTVNLVYSTVPVTATSTVKKSSSANKVQSTFKAQLANFTCRNRQRGRYGDNADCRKFYVCIGHKEPIAGLCPNNTVFSEIRKQCTKNLSHCIRENQFQCITEGRFSDYIRENNYYICVKNSHGYFVRFKFQCQKGYHLNKSSVRCQEDVEVFNQSLSSNDSPIRSTSEKKSREDKSVSNNDNEKSVSNDSKDFECKKEGKFADPNGCRKYYECTLSKKSEFRRKKRKCESDEVFHKDKKKCVDAESHEC